MNFAQLKGFEQLNFFEIALAASLKYFESRKVEYSVLEVGLGGKYDPVNCTKNPIVNVITSIGYDHTEILGNTL